jgi:adenylylsulfate kinase
MKRKILIMGLPGAGKTTLSLELAKLLQAVHLNANEIRKEINKDLSFSKEDRIEHAYRMGKLCDIITRSGHYAIADFVCPTLETRKAFGMAENVFMVWVNRTPCRNFLDTTTLFVAPTSKEYNIQINDEGTPQYWAEYIKNILQETNIKYERK